MENKDKKRIIGLYGEMSLAMKLHERGWQVYSAYIDEQIDFIIAKYFCKTCNDFTDLYIRKGKYNGKDAKAITNLCSKCQNDNLEIIVRFLQVKTSEGIKNKKNSDIRNYSFHANLKYHADPRTFYVWIAVVKEELTNILHYYIFNNKELSKFDNTELDVYQTTDNQKLTLRINRCGRVLNKGKGDNKDKYGCFNNDFYNNFNKLNSV